MLKSFKEVLQESRKIVDEAFNTRARWESVPDTPPEEDAFTTIIDGQEVLISFDTERRRDFVLISFFVDGSDNITGGGSQNKIFGAIINKVIDYVRKRRPKTIQFVSDGTPAEIKSGSRTKLYKALVRKFATNYHLDMTTHPVYGYDTFTLTHK